MSDLSKTCSRLGDEAVRQVMQAPIAELDGYWLELHCEQHGTVMMPMRRIVHCWGGRHRLADVLARFTCKVCGQPPAAAWLNETHNRTFNHGALPGWSVQLIPPPLTRQRQR